MSVTLELVVEARNRANAALTQIEGQLDRISASGVSVADKLASASKSIGLVGAAFTAGVTAPIVGSATAILSAAGQLEQYQVAFTTMLGSQEKATKLLKDLQDFSAQTPFELPQIIQAGRQLLAYGFSAEEVKKHLQLLGDVASGTGTRIEDLTYLYGTLAVQGRVYGRDILQFTNRGIPALDALAASLGKSKSEVMELVKEGSINFEDIVTAFEKLTGAGGRFEGMMQAQSQTLLGLVSTFKDNFFIAMSQIGLQLVETFDLRTKVKSALDVLEQVRVKLLELIQTNPEIVKMGVIFLAAAAMIGPFLLALSALVSVAGFVAAGLSTLGAIVGALFSPFGLLIAVVAGVAYAFYNDWGGIATFVGGVVNRLGEIFDSLRQYFGAVVEDGDYLNDFLRDLPRWMQPVVAKAGELFAKFQELGGLSGIFALLQTRVKESLDLIYSTVNEKIPIIGELLSDLKSAAQWLWEGKGKNIDWWNDITDNMVRLGLMSQSTADRLGEALFNMGASFTTAREKALEFKDGMVARLTEMYTAAKPQIDSMIETVGAMIPTFDEVNFLKVKTLLKLFFKTLFNPWNL